MPAGERRIQVQSGIERLYGAIQVPAAPPTQISVALPRRW
jgi:hypothetical protein